MGNNESSAIKRGGCVVVVEGNIGAGKSTRCKWLQERLGGPDKVLVMTEEILDHWLLEAYYRDPLKYAYALHKKTIKFNYKAMVLAETAAKGGKIVIMDRCLLGVWVFINANLSNMTPMQAVKISKRFKEALDDAPKPDLVVHLKTDPETCLANIKARNRCGEEKINLDYLQQLDQYHYEVVYDKDYKVAVMPMEFGPIMDEHLARIRAAQPLVQPVDALLFSPVEDDDTSTDDSDADPLSCGWPLTEEKAD